MKINQVRINDIVLEENERECLREIFAQIFFYLRSTRNSRFKTMLKKYKIDSIWIQWFAQAICIKK